MDFMDYLDILIQRASEKIEGRAVNAANLARYSRLGREVYALYLSGKYANVRIESDFPDTNTKPAHSITVTLEELAVTGDNRAAFQSLLGMADATVFYHDIGNAFTITYCVEGIWDE